MSGRADEPGVVRGGEERVPAENARYGGADRLTHYLYDDAGQLLSVQKVYLTLLQQDYPTYAYTANGKRKKAEDANGNVATMTHNGSDR